MTLGILLGKEFPTLDTYREKLGKILKEILWRLFKMG